jgi:hypothetical protein
MQLRIRRQADCIAVEPYYGRSRVSVTINWLARFVELCVFADLCVSARNESSGEHVSRKDAKIRKDAKSHINGSASIDQPSRNLFENGFRFGLDPLFRLILDRVCHIDRVEI